MQIRTLVRNRYRSHQIHIRFIQIQNISQNKQSYRFQSESSLDIIQFLMLIIDLYLFGFSVGLILVLIATLCLFRSPVGVIGLILVIWILYLEYKTHTSISELILIRKYP